jgi:glycosyltransferase involved in cell wall biosynthesis
MNIAKCISSARKLGPVIVLDSGSDDKTCEIARSHNAEVHTFKWNGKYPKKRNWYLINNKEDLDWVLFLDADEILTDAAINEIRSKTLSAKEVGFYLNYRVKFEGKYLKYGIKQRKLALFRVGSGLYEKIDETSWSNFDMEIHEHPILTGKVGKIKNFLLHDEYKGPVNFMEKHLEYAKWEAKRCKEIDVKTYTNFNFRQQIKYTLLKRWWLSQFYFMLGAIAFMGVLDGRRGVRYLRLKKWYFHTIYILLKHQNS